MCLAIPGKVIEILENEKIAIVDFMGLKKKVDVSLVEDVKVGDYVLVHVGYAIEKIDEKAALETLKLWREISA
ncbi:HypC/HybG/HupF family hydrogenase formation chaperone [archaeon]|nr:MAG: HypC/HybG/HupF family hydrogenase formation chaperone [archaeon]RLG65358.1 MAG: HypC/HybG/HupF family hydrogenase formation chaperone [archaeon]HDM24072.1 HypC/HybG/HupF family hydrogenase formation chaperone [Candidatus Bathyarchaeota archaeon]